jgi:hypothetical protein
MLSLIMAGADQRAGCGVVYRSRLGHGALLVVGLGEDLRHRVQVPVLAGAAAQTHGCRTVIRTPNVRSPTRAIVTPIRTRRWRCPAGGVMPAAHVGDRAADQRLTVTISTALPITRAAKVSHQAVGTQSPSGQTSG